MIYTFIAILTLYSSYKIIRYFKKNNENKDKYCVATTQNIPLLPVLKSAPSSAAGILNYLNDKDLLNLRVSNKNSLNLCQTIMGPYKTKAQFLIATSRSYQRKFDFFGSFNCYNIVQSHAQSNIKPSLLHKLRDPNARNLVRTLEKTEKIKLDGRLYSPDSHTHEGHTWQINSAWVLAHCHAQRPFYLISELKPEYMLRGYYKSEYSALAKEITMIYKAGYKVTGMTYGGYFILTSTHKNPHLLTLKDTNPEDSEIQFAIMSIKADISQLEKLAHEDMSYKKFFENNQFEWMEVPIQTPLAVDISKKRKRT